MSLSVCVNQKRKLPTAAAAAELQTCLFKHGLGLNTFCLQGNQVVYSMGGSAAEFFFKLFYVYSNCSSI